MRLVTAVAALLRRFRADRGVLALLFVLVAVTSFVVAAGPRLFERVADEGLRYEARRATAVQKNFQFSTVGQVPAGFDDELGGVAARGARLREDLPASVEALIDETRFVADSTRFALADVPRYPTVVTFRQQDGLDGRIDLRQGRWPAPVAVPPDAKADDPRRFEVVVSEAALTTSRIAVGDILPARPDRSDPLVSRRFPPPVQPIEIVVVGSFTVRDVGERFWFDDASLADATIGGSVEAPIAFVTGLASPAAYRDLLDLGLPMSYRWRQFVDPARLDAGDLATLRADLRQLETRYPTGGTPREGIVLYRSGMLPIVERYLDQRATSEAALSLAALGPVAVALGALALVSILVVRRRRALLALARGRGASGRQLLAAQLWEGLLVTIPAAVVGLVAARILVPSRPNDLSSVGALLVAFAVTALLVTATWPVARRARRELEREDPAILRVAPRRLVFEALVVGLSITAAWLLRERGLASAEAGDESRGFDPFLAASPVLIGVAVGLVTIRLYPLPVRGLGWLSGRRRDLVPVLGLRNLGRLSTAGHLPLLILMLTVAIGTFSSVVVATIERSQVAVSWQEAGADLRIESASGSPLDPAVDPDAVPGVQATAAGVLVPDVPLSVGSAQRMSVRLHAISSDYGLVVAGSPIDSALPAWFDVPPVGPGVGTAAHPIPAIVTSRFATGSLRVTRGDTFELELDDRQVIFQAVDQVVRFPAIDPAESFVIAPLESIAAVHHGTPLRPSVYFVRAPEGTGPALRASLAASPGSPTVVTRDERLGTMRDAPMVAAVGGGFTLALVVAVSYAALAVVAVVVLHAQRRSRELAFLRTLGLSGRQAAALTVVEQAVPVVLALVLGIAVGLAVAWLLAPGIDLAAFSRPDVAIVLTVEPRAILVVAVAVSVSVGLAVAASTWLLGRASVDHALRIGEA